MTLPFDKAYEPYKYIVIMGVHNSVLSALKQTRHMKTNNTENNALFSVPGLNMIQFLW